MQTLIAALLINCLLVCPALAQSHDKSGEVIVGVRTDARPYVWWDENTKGYNGFLYDLCLKAVARTGYVPKEMPVDSKARTEFLNSGVGGYDLLCDPTTLTLNRAMNFADHARRGSNSLGALQFSQIYFVANGGQVELKAKDRIDGKGAFLIKTEKLGHTTECGGIVQEVWAARDTDQEADLKKDADSGLRQQDFRQWFKDNIQLRYRGPDEKLEKLNTNVSVWGYVSGTSIEKRVMSDRQRSDEDNRTKVCLVVFENHKDAVARFCDGYLARYYGDLDIIRATISASPGTKSTCEYEEPPEQQRSYEPYAFVMSSERHPDFPNRFVAALYGLFHDNSVQNVHTASFPGVDKTNYLNTLFLINKVPSGESDVAAAQDLDE